MTIVRRIARPLLAAQFLSDGIDQLRRPGPRVETARPVVAKFAGPLRLPDDPELLVRCSGGAMLGAGSLLALGRMPRLSGFVLAATLVPTTYTHHRFWQEQDPETRRTQKVQFLKNLGLLGGTLLAAVDTEGRPGVAWRTKHAGRSAKRKAEVTAKGTKLASRQASRGAKLASRGAKRKAKKATHRAGGAVGL